MQAEAPVAKPHEALLRVDDLGVLRGGRPLFAGVSFVLCAGRVALLQGANGSGKSTLLRTLCGLTAAERGTLCVGDGAAVSPALRTLSSQALYAGHAAGIKAELSALENLRLMAALDGLAGPDADAGALLRALQVCGLERRSSIEARRLSQGQRQRIALARLALHARCSAQACRRIWLLDEPSAALDDEGDALLARLLMAQLERGGCALVATHLPLALPAQRCERWLLSNGALLCGVGEHALQPKAVLSDHAAAQTGRAGP